MWHVTGSLSIWLTKNGNFYSNFIFEKENLSKEKIPNTYEWSLPTTNIVLKTRWVNY